MAELANKQTLAESVAPVAERATGDYSAKKARAGKDIGKPGKMFSKIAKSAGKEYGSKAAGERVAGAVLNKLRTKESDEMDESALQAYIGDKKYGKEGMDALRKAGREGVGKEKMAKIRTRYNKMDEDDMEEGNEFSGELVKARAQGAKEFKVDGKSYPVKEAAKPDYIDLDKDGNRKETMKKAAQDAKGIDEKKEPRSKGTAFDPEYMKQQQTKKDAESHSRYDVTDTGYSKRYTRKAVDTDVDAGDEVNSDAPKKKGRPKGPAKGPERVTAKSYKYKSGRPAKTQEDLDTDGVMMTRASNMSSEDIHSKDAGEYDQEGDMAKDQLHTLTKAADELSAILGDDQNLPEWVQSKITKALDYIRTANDYMDQERHDVDMPIAEKAVSVAQRRAAGIAHAAQKGEISKSKLRGASKEMAKMEKGELKKFAKTKEKGLPEKVKEAEADAPQEKKSSSGFQFGKGVYESMNKQYKQALTEGMNITVNAGAGDQGEPQKSITITANGDDADKLAELLKMAGIGGGQQEETCSACGSANCGCESIDENSPDWPTNTETSNDALQYSGGLNKPKSTGQTTIPVIASQLRRQVSMEESVELERSLFKLYQNYKNQ